MKLLQIFVTGLMLFQGCSKIDDVKNDDTSQTDTCANSESAKIVNKTGLDGCTCVLQLRDGSYLEPTNPGNFSIDLKDDKPVEVSYTERSDLGSICMIGKVVDINCIQEDQRH